MIDSDTMDRLYQKAEEDRKILQSEITKKQAIDIAHLFVHLINVTHIKQPYLSDRMSDLLILLQINKSDLTENPNIEEIRLRLHTDYMFTHKINAICGFCSMGRNVFKVIHRFVYKEYYNVQRYITNHP
jgi:hypothetical protein